MVSAPVRFIKSAGLDGTVVNIRNAVPFFASLATPLARLVKLAKLQFS
jgi:hypothetical protein